MTVRSYLPGKYVLLAAAEDHALSTCFGAAKQCGKQHRRVPRVRPFAKHRRLLATPAFGSSSASDVVFLRSVPDNRMRARTWPGLRSRWFPSRWGLFVEPPDAVDFASDGEGRRDGCGGWPRASPAAGERFVLLDSRRRGGNDQHSGVSGTVIPPSASSLCGFQPAQVAM